MPKKFIKSFRYAQAGAEHAIRTQRNLWIHFAAAFLVFMLAVWMKVSWIEFAVLLLAVFAVLVAEMVNTALEELVNVLSPGQRREAELAKNIAAAAVLTAAAGALLVGGVIFLPRLF